MDNRLFFKATKRNRESIREVLSSIISSGFVLEIGSGSGEHGVFFQKCFPDVIWQTSDPKLSHRKSISSWIEYEGLNKKMPQPLALDVEDTPWLMPTNLGLTLQGIISINLIHIARWNCTKSLFKESGKLLKSGQFLVLYGPFKINNEYTSYSNILFDRSLKAQNKFWGIRNIEEIDIEGNINGFFKQEIIPMPANNFSLIYRKSS